MKIGKRAFILLFMVLLCAMAPPSDAADVAGSGSQTRGGAGGNAQLSGKPFVLPQQAVIVDVKGDGRGFWIQDTANGAVIRQFEGNSSALNTLVPKGNYMVFPNLKTQQVRASVTVIFRYGTLSSPGPLGAPPVDPITGSWLVKKKNVLNFLPDGKIEPDNGGVYTWIHQMRDYRPGHRTYHIKFTGKSKTSLIIVYLSRDGKRLYEVHAGARYEWAERPSR